MNDIWVIIPVKRLAESKSRLTAVLSPPERAQLTITLLRRTLRLLDESRLVKGSVVVSRDRRVAAIAREMGATTAAEKPLAGLNGAVTAGVRAAQDLGAAYHLILPSDLPYLSLADLRRLCADRRLQDGKAAMLAGDGLREGTNGLLLPAGIDFVFQYGPYSFPAHYAEIQRHGLTPLIIRSASLQFDLDTIADWHKYQARPTLITSTQSL